MRLTLPSTTRPLALCAIAGASLLAVCVPNASASTPTRFVYGASVYGSTASLGSAVHSGRTAKIPLCTTTPTAKSNKTAAVSLGKLGAVGAVTTTVSGGSHGSGPTTTSASRTARTSLAGLVTFDALTATAQVSHTSAGFRTTGRTSFVGLKIAGLPVNGKPSPDTTYHLAGLGTLVLDHVSTSGSAARKSVTVTGLRLTITATNTHGLAAGSVVIGHPAASLHLPVHHRAYGTAFGTSVALGSTLTSGATAAAYLDCGGTDGVTHTNNVAGASLPTVFHAGALTSRAKSTDTSTATSVTTTSHITNISLLGGIITASAVTAQSTTTRTHSGLKTSPAGTATVGLTINGHHLSTRIAANTTIKIPGVGTLVVDQVSRTADHTGLQVHALSLTLSKTFGSAEKGSLIIIGSARSGVHA